MNKITQLGFASLLSSCFAGLALPASAQDSIPLIDSYTVDQRYYRNIESHPEIEWPTLKFAPVQTISFDRLYKEEDGRKLHVDVFGPSAEAQNGRAVILVHGGAWRSGNKSHMFLLANLLAQRGYTVFTPEYRLSAEAPYPAGLVDLNDLIVWVRENSETFGYDAEAVAIAGGSSGGHMAALLGFSSGEPVFKSNPDDVTRVAAVIDMDGVLDFRTELALSYENRAGANSGVGLWVGGAYETATDLWVEASPVAHLAEDAPPTLIISSGNPRFTEGHLAVEDWLTARDTPYEFYSYEDLFHTFWLFEPYASEVADRIDGFLEQVASDTTPDQ